jgi:hypothetical protein
VGYVPPLINPGATDGAPFGANAMKKLMHEIWFAMLVAAVFAAWVWIIVGAFDVLFA